MFVIRLCVCEYTIPVYPKILYGNKGTGIKKKVSVSCFLDLVVVKKKFMIFPSHIECDIQAYRMTNLFL